MAARRGLDALRVPEALDAMPSGAAPPEVEAALLSLDFPALARCKRLKVSFHATYFLDFAGPLPGQAGPGAGRAVLQLLGSELGDKAYFDLAKPISAESIEKATSLAEKLGIRVPRVLASGDVEEWGPLRDVPFLVYEFIDTKTVEDEVLAPDREWHRIEGQIKDQLASSMAGVDTEPLPRFEDCFAFVAYLARLATEARAADLSQALARMEALLRERGVQAVPPQLIHQDLNGGNILCSPDPGSPHGAWRLDALIDWEGAVVGDPRVVFDRSEPWSILRKLAMLTKVRWLAAAASGQDGIAAQLPRCCAEELVEDYEEVASKLVQAGWLPSVAELPPLDFD